MIENRTSTMEAINIANSTLLPLGVVEPKYRICQDPETGSFVVFFCDWDHLFISDDSFLGKPVCLTDANVGDLSFRQKEIRGEIYYDILKLSPEAAYLPDYALKLILLNKAHALFSFPSSTVLSMLCEIKKETIVWEVTATSALKVAIKRKNKFTDRLNRLRDWLPENIVLGLVGYEAISSNAQGKDLDVVLIAENIDELIKVEECISDISCKYNTEYINKLWPLSARSDLFGPLDFFFCSLQQPSIIHQKFSHAKIENQHVEFSGLITDDKGSMLSMPLWVMDNFTFLVSVDGALRGRVKRGGRVSGVGIQIAIPEVEKRIILVYSSTCISIENNE